MLNLDEPLSPEEEALTPLLTLRAMQAGTMDASRRREDAMRRGYRLGPSTGFKPIDDLLDGYMAPGLHIIHGSPGSGKSAIALTMATECQCPALYISGELRPDVVYRRIISRITQMNMSYVKRLPPSAMYTATEQAIAHAPMFAMLDATYQGASIIRIKRAVDALKHSYPDHSHGGVLVVIDSAHTWATRQYGDKLEYERLNYALAHLEALGQATESPILTIAERNRASRADSGISSAKGSGRFEYAGESVMSLDEVVVDSDTPPGDAPQDCTPVTLTVSKNRDGLKGRIHLTWHGATQTHRIADNLDPKGQF